MPIVIDYSTNIPTVPLDDLTDRVRSEVRLCPYDLVFQKAIDVIREFCRFTRAWQYYPAPKTVVAGTATYDITLPNENAEVIQVEWMTVDDGLVESKTVRELDAYQQAWRTNVADDFRFFTQEISRQFTFGAVPLTNGTADGVKYRISMQPALDATRCGEDLMNEWEEIFAEGIKARLFKLSQRPWTDLAAGKICDMAYYQGKHRARIQAWRQFATNEESFQAKYKFAGR